MTDEQRAAMERAAIVQFMGQTFAEAKKIDSEMVERSSTLQPTSQRVEQALKSHLQSNRPAMIPPAATEARAAAVAAGTPAPQPLPSQIDAPPMQTSFTPPPAPYTGTPVEHLAPSTTVPGPGVPVMERHENVSNYGLLEVSRKLDIIIGQLAQLIQLMQPTSWSATTDPNIKLYEDTSQEGEPPTIPGSDPEGE